MPATLRNTKKQIAAENGTSSPQGEAKRAGNRWKPGVGAAGEWTQEPPAESPFGWMSRQGRRGHRYRPRASSERLSWSGRAWKDVAAGDN